MVNAPYGYRCLQLAEDVLVDILAVVEELLSAVDVLLVDVLLSDPPLFASLPFELPPAMFFLLPVLKSVSYQPDPVRRKAGTDSSFFRSGLWQLGQSTSGASLNFWMDSNWCVQLEHWYS
jgi:hypothetical protein